MMPEWTPEYMNEMVSIDLDLPLIKRWQSMAIFFPDMADDLARAYGTKAERKQMKALKNKNPSE